MSSADAYPQRLTLTVLTPEGDVARRLTFDPGETVSVGRSDESDVSLAEFGSNVSRCHAVLLHDSHRWEYYNLGVNGSYRDGRRIETALVDNGLMLRLSKRGPILHFRLSAVPESNPRTDSD